MAFTWFFGGLNASTPLEWEFLFFVLSISTEKQHKYVKEKQNKQTKKYIEDFAENMTTLTNLF